MSKYNPNQFYKFDVRISQLSEEINAAARLIYMVMVHSCDFYEEKYKAYSPSIDHLAYMAGVSKRTAIRAIETLEKHGLIQVQKNQGRQSTYRVFTLDDKPELLVRPTSQEVAASVRQNDTTTSDKMSSVPVTKCHGGSDKMSPVLDKLLDKTLDNNIIDKNKDTELDDGINEDDFLSLDELNDFLSMNESDLDSEATKETSKTSDLEEDKISDVIASSDHKNTQCPATDDELPDVDLDDEEDPEEELKREQRKAGIKERFRKAKLKNRVDELDDFDDSDDDFTFTPKKKTHTEPKKEKVKVRRVYGGGMF
ncbi:MULTISPECIES: helix-turn-helix domain-containing protein [Enterobacteriaceae]|uniref:helix-turn-helix domain-containing protein n=1 Tax=Enterobacteriaceae TaxID=543 RepID=UPI000DDD5DC0|nr:MULTISPECIES: helix-turn-helix domain-containing protein [Enterobacteriaceae]EFV2004933.1 helix-turn-helix domain-containing protein [Escherichia coli]EMF1793970.1 helix-turn-helix domain-containing protein [Escherichia coli]MBO1970338.1 helix-turn-helix domain-containing protein [Salmonella sp. 32040203-2019-00097]MCA7281046.1 helix-turn-helix domain-containing protein [Escherichia coli]MCK2502143.1 helix-turn-helix domain-containing protein [Escherichia coli]